MIADIDKALEEINNERERAKDQKPSLLHNLHRKQEQIRNAEQSKSQAAVEKHNIVKNQREGER